MLRREKNQLQDNPPLPCFLSLRTTLTSFQTVGTTCYLTWFIQTSPDQDCQPMSCTLEQEHDEKHQGQQRKHEIYLASVK